MFSKWHRLRCKEQSRRLKKSKFINLFTCLNYNSSILNVNTAFADLRLYYANCHTKLLAIGLCLRPVFQKNFKMCVGFDIPYIGGVSLMRHSPLYYYLRNLDLITLIECETSSQQCYFFDFLTSIGNEMHKIDT